MASSSTERTRVSYASDRVRPRSLLVHIAFHYVEGRTKYLQQLVTNFAHYEIDRIEVVVDTNSESTTAFLATLPAVPHVLVRAQVHSALSHPFGLTWAHRSAMSAQREDFDLFMYIEDDILVPWPAIVAWMTDVDALYSQGYLRGFLRVEKNLHDQLVASDWMVPLRNPVVYERVGARYVRPAWPYHAFWIYTAKQLQHFISFDVWGGLGVNQHSTVFRADEDWWANPQSMRERAAYGMQYAHPGQHHVLLPLAANGQLSEDCYVYHLPNTYGLKPDDALARHRVEALLVGMHVPERSLGAAAVKARDTAESLLLQGRERVRKVPWLHAAMRAVQRALFPNRDPRINT